MKISNATEIHTDERDTQASSAASPPKRIRLSDAPSPSLPTTPAEFASRLSDMNYPFNADMRNVIALMSELRDDDFRSVLRTLLSEDRCPLSNVDQRIHFTARLPLLVPRLTTTKEDIAADVLIPDETLKQAHQAASCTPTFRNDREKEFYTASCAFEETLKVLPLIQQKKEYAVERVNIDRCGTHRDSAYWKRALPCRTESPLWKGPRTFHNGVSIFDLVLIFPQS